MGLVPGAGRSPRVKKPRKSSMMPKRGKGKLHPEMVSCAGVLLGGGTQNDRAAETAAKIDMAQNQIPNT